MKIVFDEDTRPSDSPLVEAVWRSRTEASGSFISAAVSHMEMVITRQNDVVTFGVRGPETKATPAPIPEDAEIFGIMFRLGTFLPHLPPSELVNRGISLPEAAGQSFWLQGSAWEIPSFDNADTFVNRLVRQGLLAHEPIVEAALNGQMKDLSVRSVQRRFLRATGLTHGTMYQIERARHALTLLQHGVSILDTVEQAGYYDQSHLTRSLKHLIGHTPAQVLGSSSDE